MSFGVLITLIEGYGGRNVHHVSMLMSPSYGGEGCGHGLFPITVFFSWLMFDGSFDSVDNIRSSRFSFDKKSIYFDSFRF